MTHERLFIETLLVIPDKDGQDVDFILNDEQAELDANLTGRDIIAKARQRGFSTYVLGRMLVRCLSERNRRCVIVSHSATATQKLLERIHYMIKHLKCPPPVLKHTTQNYITFGKMDSSISIGTAGSGDIGVGDTITDLHCSEVSRWANPEELLKGLFQAVPPSGNIIIESTGHGQGNWYHKAVMRAAQGVGYKLHFFNWLRAVEYMVPGTEAEDAALLANLDVTTEEDKYHRLGLSAAQLRWRRMKLAEIDFDLSGFKENYPVTLSECFQSTGSGVFPYVRFVADPLFRAVDPWCFVLGDHPKVDRPYVAGIDIGGGVGGDYSVVEIFDAETGEQVLEYRNNRIQPHHFAQKAINLCRQFNYAYMNPERNNHGYAFISWVITKDDDGKPRYPLRLVHRAKPPAMNNSKSATDIQKLSDYGTYTTDVLKVIMVDALKKQMEIDLTFHSETAQMEMNSFIERDNGSMGAEVGCYDDAVMASGLAAYARPLAMKRWLADRNSDRQRAYTREVVFEAGAILRELEGRYHNQASGYPIESHVE